MEALLPVANVLGRLMMLFSLAYVVPIAGSFAFGDGVAHQFFLAMLVTIVVGTLLTFSTRGYFRELKVRDGFLLVTLSWVLMAGIGSVPLLLVYTDLSFTNAFFETMSGLTTTGATVLTGLDHAPQSINLWRHQLSWLGGLGIIVLAVAILPLLGVGGMQLYRAEMPGPMKETKLTSRIADTAKALWLIYVGLTLFCMVALRLAGMSWFDAICHGFSAVSLGGFSTRDANIAAFDSAAIEAVLAVFMVLGGINFATHFLAWRGRDLRCYVADAEFRGYVFVLAAAVAGLTAYLACHGTYGDPWTTLRHGAFNVVSIALCSGYTSADFEQWPAFVPLAMLFLSCITASSGSTGSGIKMVRTLILYKQGLRELHKMLHPSAAELIKLGRVVVPNKVAFSVLGFIFIYFMTVAGATFLLLLSGLDFLTAMSAAVASVNNVGPGLGQVGPSAGYGTLTDFQKWVCIAAMLAGRLEIMSVLVIFTRSFWRK